MTPSLPRAAAWYAAHGWPVFPCQGKEPLTRHGVSDATTDEATIITWWKRWPWANISLHVGGAGLLGLDLDSYKESYQGAPFLTSEDQRTITNLTGRGGTHLLYRQPEGARLGNGTGRLPPGIDIRGWGGYLVLPPSVHPDTGRRYCWEVGYGPHEIEPLPMPAGLLALLQPQPRPQNGAAFARRSPIRLKPCAGAILTGATPEGTRNVTAWRLALHLRSDGWSEASAQDLLTPWAGRSGLPEKSLLATIKSAFQENRGPGHGCRSRELSPHCKPDCPLARYLTATAPTQRIP